MCHSYDVIIKQINKKKLKQSEPLIIKKKETGINTNELNILF